MWATVILGVVLLLPGPVPSPVETISQGTRAEVEAAVAQVRQHGGTASVTALSKIALGEKPGSRANAAYALELLGPPKLGPFWRKLLAAEDPSLRATACEALGHLKSNREAIDAVSAHLGDPLPAVRSQCARTIGLWSAKTADAKLMAAFRAERDHQVRFAQVEAMGHAGGALCAAILQGLPPGTDPALRLAAVRSMAMLNVYAGRIQVEKWCQSKVATDREAAVDILAVVTAVWAADDLLVLMSDPEAEIAIRASQGLIARNDKRGLQNLVSRAAQVSGPDKDAFEKALAEAQSGLQKTTPPHTAP